jgi:phage protein D
MTTLNIVPAVPSARQPRGMVLLGDPNQPGTSVPWIDWDVDQNTWHSASTFRMRLPVSALTAPIDLNYVLSTNPIQAQIFAGFPGDPDHYGTADLQQLITGNVDQIHFDPVRRVVELSGRDYTSLLIDAKTFDRWTNQTASEIATTLAKRHGLTPKVTATTGAVGKIYEIDKIHDRHGSTEWELLTWLASIYDFVVYVQGMTLYFGPKPNPNTATPYALQWKQPDGLTATTFQGNVLDMSFSRTLTVGKGVVVQVHSTNHKQKQGFTATYPDSKAKGIKPGSASAPEQVYSYIIANLTQQDAQQRAQQIYNDIIRHELKMTAELPGDNILQPNVMVSVSGTQTPFDTMYYVEAVSRRMSFDSGYTMSVRGKNHSLDTTTIPS